MPSQVLTSVENNFTKGFVTEFTGMNFPENAATDADNTEFTIIGDTVRRLGVDYETNYTLTSMERTGKAINTYKWNNAGDSTNQVVVSQVGGALYFYNVTNSTTVSPLSSNISGSSVALNSFVATGGTFDATKCCEFAEGNGYLFVFHPSCDPVYVTYVAGVFTATVINVQIRDFAGVMDGFADNTRPSGAAYSVRHAYNLQNQGWTSGSVWAITSSSAVIAGTGSKAFTVAAGVSGISGGQNVVVAGFTTSIFGRQQVATLTGTVSSYVGTTLTLSITYATGSGVGLSLADWELQAAAGNYISSFNTAIGVYPSNADQWWRFKNASGVFDPGTTVANTSLGLGIAPKGHYILSAFYQDRTGVAPETGTFTVVTTTARPTNGAWFQGRIWYTGVAAFYAQDASGNNSTNWTNNIYFSKIVNTPADFGRCYQDNDPTSEELFDLLPTDGGVITIQGSGQIHRLFPIQNGMLVFADNGVWFITGSQGIGFAATDYTITKISNTQSISSTSFVNVQGLPYFWNEEGIYAVTPAQQGGLEVNPITVSTILSFYSEIPLEAKKVARGAYHPIDYVIQWIYKDSNSTDTTDKFTYDRILNLNTFNKAFYPYTIDTTASSINGIVYVSGPGGSTTVLPSFKYFSSDANKASTTFADLHDENYEDWASSGNGVDFTSYFITGYKLHGQGQRRFQLPYVYVFSRNESYNAYKIQGLWDYATSGNTGRWSTAQIVENFVSNHSTVFRRHKIRGQGLALQLKITSVSGLPFGIVGWSAFETQNTGV